MRSSKSGSPKDGQSKNQSKETFWQKRVSQVESVSKLLLNKNKSKQNTGKETKDKKKQQQTAGEQLECLKKALESLTQKEAELSKRQPKDSPFDSAPPKEVENLLKNVRSDDILCYSDGKNSLIYCPSEKGINFDFDASDDKRGRSTSKSTVKRSASPEPCEKIRGGEEPYHRTREVCDGKNTRGGSSNHRMSVDRRHSDRCKRDEKRESRERCRADVKKSSEKKPKWSEACKQICKKKAAQKCLKTGHLSAGRGRTRSDDEDSLKGQCKRRHSDVEERGKKGGRKEEKDTRSRGSQATLKRSSERHGSRDRERHRDRNCRTEPKRSCSRPHKEDSDRERKRSSHRSGTREKTEAGRSVSREPETPPKRRSSLKRTSPSARRSGSSGYLRDSYGNEPSPSLGYPAQCPPCPPCPNSSYLMQNGSMPAWNSTLPPHSPVAYPDSSFGGQCGFVEPEFDASSIRYPQGAAMSTPIPRRNARVGGHMDCPSSGYMETLPEHTMGSGYSQRPSMAHHSMTPLPILRGSRGPPSGPATNASVAISAPAMYGRSASSIPGRPVSVSFPPQSPFQGQQFPSQDRLVSTPSGGIVCCNTCCRPAPCCCPTQFCVVDNPCAACADPEYYECGKHIHETPSPMCNYHRYLCERQKSAIAESTAELDNTYLRDCMPMSAPRFDKTKLYADPKGRRLQPSLSCHGLSPSQLQHPVDPQMMNLLYRNKLDKEKTPESTGVFRGGASSFQSAPSNIRTPSTPGTPQNFRSSSPSRTSRIPRKQPTQGTPSIPGTSSRFGTQSNPKTHSSTRPSSNFRTQSNSRIQSIPRTYSISKSQSVYRASSNAKTPPVPRAASIPMTSSFPGSKSPYLPRNDGANYYICGNSCLPCPQTRTYPGRAQYSCQTPYNVTLRNAAYSNGSKYTVSNNYPLNQRTRGGRETPTRSSPVSRTSDRSVHVDKTPSSSFRSALQETPTENMTPSGCPSEYIHRPLLKIPIPSYPSVRRVVNVSNKTPREITISVTPNPRTRTGASVYSDPNILSGHSTPRPLHHSVHDKSAPNSPEKDELNTKESHFPDSTLRAASIHVPPTFQEYRHFPSDSCPKMPPLHPNIPSYSVGRTSLPPVSLSFPPTSLSNIGFSISVTPTARVSRNVESDGKSKVGGNSLAPTNATTNSKRETLAVSQSIAAIPSSSSSSSLIHQAIDTKSSKKKSKKRKRLKGHSSSKYSNQIEMISVTNPKSSSRGRIPGGETIANSARPSVDKTEKYLMHSDSGTDSLPTCKSDDSLPSATPDLTAFTKSAKSETKKQRKSGIWARMLRDCSSSIRNQRCATPSSLKQGMLPCPLPPWKGRFASFFGTITSSDVKSEQPDQSGSDSTDLVYLNTEPAPYLGHEFIDPCLYDSDLFPTPSSSSSEPENIPTLIHRLREQKKFCKRLKRHTHDFYRNQRDES